MYNPPFRLLRFAAFLPFSSRNRRLGTITLTLFLPLLTINTTYTSEHFFRQRCHGFIETRRHRTCDQLTLPGVKSQILLQLFHRFSTGILISYCPTKLIAFTKSTDCPAFLFSSSDFLFLPLNIIDMGNSDLRVPR